MTPQRQVVPGQTWKRTQRVLLVDDDTTYRGSLNACLRTGSGMSSKPHLAGKPWTSLIATRLTLCSWMWARRE